MYITDKYVFVHCQKTGGMFVKYWMIKNLGARRYLYKHVPLRFLEEKDRDRIKIGIVRNPYAWYVSYYTYMVRHKKIKGTFREFLLWYLYHPRDLLVIMKEKFKGIYPPETELPIGAWSYYFINYFSFEALRIFRWSKMYWKYQVEPVDEMSYEEIRQVFLNDLDVLMRTENLREDMIKLFGEEHRESIYSAPDKNVSHHDHYMHYYDKELIDLVRARDGVLMDHLDYRF